MIHMIEDDSHSFSPSLRSPRRVSMNPGKRARSPDGSGSPRDRPSKRPSLAFAGVSRRLGYGRLSDVSSASSSRQTSEDWVQQTGGLTIDSPIYLPSEHGRPFTPQDEPSGDFGDVDMVMDSEDNHMHESLSKPQLALHTSPLPYLPSNPVVHSHVQPVTPNIPRHTYGTRYAERIQASAFPPLINILPATPVHTNVIDHLQHTGHGASASELMYSAPQPSTPPPSSPVPMAISPTTSFTQLASPMTSKRRVVFGPRSNCEKCRAGERHFIHYE